MSEAAAEQDAQTTNTVDWGALWEEFGFDTADAAGNQFASGTQLVAAIQSTDQSVTGDPEGLIKSGVDGGQLHKLTVDRGLRGYIYTGGADE